MSFTDYLGFLNLGVIMIAIIFMVALGVGIAIFVRVMSTATAPKAKEHWARLGYRSAEGARQISMFRESIHQIRDYKNWEVHYTTSRKVGLMSKFSESWVCQLPSPVRFGLQVIEKNEASKPDRTMSKGETKTHSYGSSMGRGARSFAWYNWKQYFTERFETGDSELDSRFAIFGTDVNAARALLSNPITRDALLSLRHVDFSVAGDEVRFEDPFKSNYMWVRGATIEDLANIHNQIAEVVTLAASEAI
jgi:hypothetical protein